MMGQKSMIHIQQQKIAYKVMFVKTHCMVNVLLLPGVIFFALIIAGCSTGLTAKSDMSEQQQLKLVELAQQSLDKKDYLAVRSYLEKYTEIAEHTPRTLWLGVQAEYVMGNQYAVSSYVQQLRENYPESDEYKAYMAMLRSRFMGH